MDKLNLFVPITKVDTAQRLVYGVATAEQPDIAKEVCDYASTKPLYEKWSKGFSDLTDGKSLGNLRAMHGKVAAGKLTSINFNDAEKQIEICAKVVDDAEWDKVEQGVYTGFSQGGRYVKRWKDGDLIKYTADPIEVSLVDTPCLPSATFQVIKEGGAVELRKFTSVAPLPEPTSRAIMASNQDIAAKATELAKAAGDETKWTDFIAPARDVLAKETVGTDNGSALGAGERKDPAADGKPVEEKPAGDDAAKGNAIEGAEQVWTHASLPGQVFKKKADLRTALDKAATDAAGNVADPVLDKIEQIKKEIAAKPAAAPAFAIMKTIVADLAKAETPEAKAAVLAKGMYDVARLAGLLSELSWLYDSVKWEAITEGDGSMVPASLQGAISNLCAVLRALVIEETAELVDEGQGADASLIEMAAGLLPHGHIDALVKSAVADKDVLVKNAKAEAPMAAFADALEKIGARHSKADMARIGKMHALAVELGAACETEKMAKAAGDVERLTAENTALKAKDAEHLSKLDEVLGLVKTLKTDVETVKNQPMPGGPARAVHKHQDNGSGGDDNAALAEQLSKLSPEQMLTEVIKAAQSKGRTIG